MDWIWTRFGIARKRDGNRQSRFPFLHREEWKKKKEKNESGSVLAGQAGMELTGCRRMFDVTVLPAGLAERQNVVFRCSPGCKPSGGVCGARSPAYLFASCVLLPAKFGILDI